MSYAVITGASAGIGREFARLLANEGYDLVLLARRRDRLEALRDELPCDVRVLEADLSDPATPQRVLEATRGLEVEVLVNNAGVTPVGRLLDRSWAEQHGIAQVMAMGPAHLIHLLLPDMLERRRGHVINVVSVGAWYRSTPTQTLYGATKAFLLRLTETLADEYPESGVSFTAVCPGVTRTEILDQPFNAAATDGIPARLVDPPERVAELGWAAARAGRTVVVTGVTGRIAHAGLTLLSRRASRAVARKLIKADESLRGAHDG